jgi:hypothetical protein
MAHRVPMWVAVFLLAVLSPLAGVGLAAIAAMVMR